MSEKSKRRLELSITAVFVLALLLVGAVLIFTGGAASAKQIATLRLFGGTVEVQQKGSETFEPGREGVSLHEGDTVRTGPTGRAAIDYFDGSLTRLDHDTTFTMVTLETLGNPESSKVIVGRQDEGSSYNRVAELTDSESRFDVETPTATASVQGTDYALIVEGGTTTVAVVHGEVRTTGEAGSVTVPAGKMVSVDAAGTIGAVQDISDDLLNSEWLSYNLCELDDDATCVQGGSVEPPTKPDKEPNTPDGDRSQSPPPTVTTPPAGDGSPPPPSLNQAPIAGFSASPDVGAAPLHVDFHDTSSDPDGDAIARHWSFGDGASQDGGTSPTHTYRDPGEYTVTLSVEDPSGETDSKSKVIHVGRPNDDEAPVVRITSKPPDPSHSRDATFRFRSSEAGTGFVCTLDGDSDPCGGAGGGAPVDGSASYSGLSQGSHVFRVSMTDASGNTGSDSYSWTIDTGEPEFDHVVIAPSNATIQPGGSQNYTAEAFDTQGNSMGNVTSDTSFSIAPNGSCTGNTCTANQPGNHTVTGTFSGDSDAATLVVEESSPPPCPNYALSFHARPPDSIDAGGRFNVQVRVDVLQGGSDDGPLTISLSLSGGGFAGGDKVQTWTGQGTVTFNHLSIDEPGSYAITATAPCASPTDAAAIVVTESGHSNGPLGLVLVAPGLLAARRRR